MKAKATKRAMATAKRVVSDNYGDGDGGKSDGNGNVGGGQAKPRAMEASTTVVGNNEGNADGNEGGEQQRG